MAEFDTLFQCTLGGSNFQLHDYGYKYKPIVEDGKGQTGVEIEVDGDGWVESDSPSNFAAALSAATAAFRVRGQNFTLYGLSGVVELSILAAACIDGGPFVSFEMLPQGDGARLVKQFKFALTAKQSGNPSNGNPTHAYKVKVVTRPDDLSRVTVSGEIKGQGAAAFFNAAVLPQFNATYRLADWVPTVTYEGNQTDDAATYTLEYKELDESLPSPIGGNAVDGTATDATERDEQMRLVRTLSFDFLCTGDPMALRDFMRAQLGSTPFKERFTVSRYDEVRAQGEFQVLMGGDGTDLMNWERSIQSVEQQTDTFEAFAVPGSTPIFVKKPGQGFTYLDSGRAIGAGRFPKKPAWLYRTFAAPDEVTYTDLNAIEKETAWKYTYLLQTPVENHSTFAAALARPDTPEFLK